MVSVMVVTCFYAVVVAWLVVWHQRDVKSLRERQRVTESRLRQVYFLLDFISYQQRPPNLVYSLFRGVDPDKMPSSKKEALMFFRDTFLKKYAESREYVCTLVKEETDIEVRAKLGATLVELETAITLLSSVDNDASEVYIEEVFKNTSIITEKIAGIQYGY